jgi:hypothetical protein
MSIELGFVANVVSILSALSAFLGALYAGWQSYKTRREAQQERERQNQHITIVLKDTEGTREYVLPARLRREHLTRSELMGHLGMVRKNHKEPFELAYLRSRPFFETLERCQEGGGPMDFFIPATSNEIAQFRVKEERPATPTPGDNRGVEAGQSDVALQARPITGSASSASS